MITFFSSLRIFKFRRSIFLNEMKRDFVLKKNKTLKSDLKNKFQFLLDNISQISDEESMNQILFTLLPLLLLLLM